MTHQDLLCVVLQRPPRVGLWCTAIKSDCVGSVLIVHSAEQGDGVAWQPMGISVVMSLGAERDCIP